MAWQPGNEKGWGDPLPFLYLVLGLILLSSLVDRLGVTANFQQRCQQVLQGRAPGQ
jgi:hypothetical protein